MRRIAFLLMMGCGGAAQVAAPDMLPTADLADPDLTRVRTPAPDFAQAPDLLPPPGLPAGAACVTPSAPSPECDQNFAPPRCNQATHQEADCTNTPSGPLRQVCVQWVHLASGGDCFSYGYGWMCTGC